MSGSLEGGGELTERERWLVTVAMMLAMSVAALEQTVVATAMPRIIASLGGGELYAWVFSAYLLAATVSTPLYGKLADLWGRKRLLLFGLGLFLLGSILSGTAQSMGQLIVMRAVQGLGAGAMMPIVLTILGDIYTLRERAKVQGYFSAVWGVASVAGPTLGGVLTDSLSWRWVFFVPLPFGLVAAAVVAWHFREVIQRREIKPIDWPGAAMLAAGSTGLLMAVLGGAGESDWAGPALAAGSIALLVGFALWERRAADPVVPMDLLLSPTILAAVIGSFLVGALLFGLDMFVPLYLQGVLGRSATDAGKLLTPLFLSWSISVAVAAKVVVRFGFRSACVSGTLSILAGIGLICAGANTPPRAELMFAVGMVLIGVGMGPTSLAYILSVQNAVEWGRRGVATAAVTFFRSMGGALGVALLGAALLFDLGRRLPGLTDLTAALRAETLQKLPADRLAQIQGGLGDALRDIFLLMLGTTLLGLFTAARLPAGRPEAPPVPRPRPEAETPEADATVPEAESAALNPAAMLD